MSRLLKILVALTGAALVVAAILFVQVTSFLDAPVQVEADGSEFEIPTGTTFRQISSDLGDRGIVSHPTLFRLYARASGMASSVHSR